MVKFVDLSIQHEQIKTQVNQAFTEIMDNTAFVLGEKVEQFEKDFAEYCGTDYCVAVNSGTSALHLALLACGIGEYDTVITAPNTFIATAEAISYTGAEPRFVDIDPVDYTMKPLDIIETITSDTKAIIPVHLYGNICNMDAILDIAQQYNLFVIEDACQAHGAEYKGKKAGSIGDVGCFSFYPSKNLGGYGEGGAVVTDSKVIRDRIIKLRNHGSFSKYNHDYIGYNYRMDAFQGAVLDIKLKYLDEWNQQRIRIARLYNELLTDSGVEIPKKDAWTKHVYHLYVIRSQYRDKLWKHLNDMEIQTGIHYPKPIHLQRAYSHLGYFDGDFPIAEQHAKEILSLPMYPGLSNNEIWFVANQVQAAERIFRQ